MTLNEYNNSIPTQRFKITQKPNEPPRIANSDLLKKSISFNESTGQLLENPKPNYRNWIIGILALAGILLLLSKIKKKSVDKLEENETPFDYLGESLKYLEKARQNFQEKKYKDAYEGAGYAIRLYISYKNQIKTELTNYETIRYLKEHKKKYKEIQDCLNMCQLVEFAKYKPNQKDFTKIIETAKKIIR